MGRTWRCAPSVERHRSVTAGARLQFSMWLSTSQRLSRLALPTRVIGALLLTAIVWASTFEFTHHHGLGSATLAQRVARDRQTNSNREVASRQSPPLSSRARTSECSICQLQRNLATTLISQRVDITADAAPSTTLSAFTQIELADFSESLHGRAPPLFSLS